MIIHYVIIFLVMIACTIKAGGHHHRHLIVMKLKLELFALKKTISGINSKSLCVLNESLLLISVRVFRKSILSE